MGVVDVDITGAGMGAWTPKRTLATCPIPPCASALDEVVFQLSI
jgi:hypothetical protein